MKKKIVEYLKSKNDKHLVEVIRGSLISVGGKVLGTALSFLFNFMLAQKLGAHGAGQYFLVISIVMIAVIFSTQGLDIAAIRVISAHAIAEEWAEIKGFFKKSIKIIFLIASISSLVVIAFSEEIALQGFHKPELEKAIRYGALSIIPLSLAFYLVQALKALKQIWHSTLIQFQGGIIFFLIMLPFSFLVIPANGVEGVIWVFFVATCSVSAVGFFFWRKATAHVKIIRPKSPKTSTMFKTSTPLFFFAISGLISTWASTIILGVYVSEESIGIYNIAAKISFLASFVLASILNISAPKFAELHRVKEMLNLKKTVKHTITISLVTSLPLVLVFMTFPTFILEIFGKEFGSGRDAFIILIVGQIINIVTGTANYLLMMSNNEKSVMKNVVLGGIISLSLSIILIPWLGIIGAAIATICNTITINLLSVWQVKSKLKFNILDFFSY